MLVVDSQIHIWADSVPTNAIHRQIPTYSVDDVLIAMQNPRGAGGGGLAGLLVLG